MRGQWPVWLRNHLAALRVLVVLTVILGIAYPLAITAVAQVPGLQHRADGSLLHRDDAVVGSALIGQAFTDAQGNPIPTYFQSRPSAAGDGYDPTSTGASNLGPESIVDGSSPSLLTQVCSRSRAVGQLEGVDGRRPYCTAAGIGAVLSIVHADGLTGPLTEVVSVNQLCPARPFLSSYDGVSVSCATSSFDPYTGVLVPIHGPGRAWPANPVPPDAVTASGSGLDPDISTAYATLQTPRVAAARDLPVAIVSRLVHQYTVGRTLGFMGEPAVNVVQLNLALDRLSSS